MSLLKPLYNNLKGLYQCFGKMHDLWKICLVTLILVVTSHVSFAQCTPTSLMGGLYKTFTKVIANRLHKVLSSVVHPMQYGIDKAYDHDNYGFITQLSLLMFHYSIDV